MRFRLLLSLLIIILIGLSIASLVLGTFPLSPTDIVNAFLVQTGLNDSTWLQNNDHIKNAVAIIFYIRLPRLFAALGAGWALALAGTVMQGLLRNPLAGPEILGVSAGASLGAVLAIALGMSAVWEGSLASMAVIGSLVTGFAIFSVGAKAQRGSLYTIILAGMAISSLVNGAVSAVLLFSKEYEVNQFVFWTMGGLEGRQWFHIVWAFPLIALSSLVFFASAKTLNLLLLGEDQAHASGLSIATNKLVLLSTTAICTAMAIVLAGPIGFIGLLVPHFFRMIVGSDHKKLLPLTALGGAAFLTFADLIGRTLFSPLEIKAGIITAMIGSPFFLILVFKNRARSGL